MLSRSGLPAYVAFIHMQRIVRTSFVVIGAVIICIILLLLVYLYASQQCTNTLRIQSLHIKVGLDSLDERERSILPTGDFVFSTALHKTMLSRSGNYAFSADRAKYLAGLKDSREVSVHISRLPSGRFQVEVDAHVNPAWLWLRGQ